ncbi:MAG: two-component regulator propeller domain-containing protein, partial [Bacteroidota bacterium]
MNVKLTIIAFLITCTMAYSQEYPGIEHFTPQKGLPSSEVYDILQDRKGYIWISTDHGVCRYNGYEFTYFGKEEGITNPVILYLYEDHRGWIWMGAYQDEFFIYKEGEIETFKYNQAIQEITGQFSPSTLRWIQVDEGGTFYASFPNLGVISVDNQGKLNVILEEEEDYVWRLWEQRDKVRFTYNNPDPIDVKNYTGSVPLTPYHKDNKSNYVFKIPWINPVRYTSFFNNFSQKKGEDYFFQTSDTLHLLDSKTLETITKRHYPYGVISSIIESRFQPYVFVGHLSEPYGLHIFPNRVAMTKSDSIASMLHLLKGKVISHLLEDWQGGLWISTNESGIYYIREPSLLLGIFQDERLKSLTGVTLKDENTCFVRTKTNEVFAIDGEKRAVHPLPFTQTSSFHSDALYYDTIQHRLYVTGFLRFWDEDKDKWKFVLPP